jgi:carboxylesterase type B
LTKAIIQSGGSPPTLFFPGLEQCEQNGKDFASATGCKEQTSEALRSIPAKDIVAANLLPDGVFGVAKFPFGIMEDGIVVPRSMRSVFSAGDFSAIPIITGVNRDEFSWFRQ